MEQIKIAKCLQFFSIVTALIIGLFFFWYLPIAVISVVDMYPEIASLKETAILCIVVIALLCYIAIYNFWNICTQMKLGNSFCYKNAKAMRNIGIIAGIILLILLTGTIFLGIIGYLSGPFVVMMFFLVFVTCGIIVICIALSKLIENAAKIKEENDLTI